MIYPTAMVLVRVSNYWPVMEVGRHRDISKLLRFG